MGPRVATDFETNISLEKNNLMSTKRRNFPVQGMGCAACVARVEGALKAAKGVSAVNVSLASNSAQVDYDPEQTTPGAFSASDVSMARIFAWA